MAHRTLTDGNSAMARPTRLRRDIASTVTSRNTPTRPPRRRGGEDGSVVGQDRGGCAPVGEGRGDGVDDVGAGGDGSGDTGDGQSGVVVDDVEDFDLAVIGQAPVGDVGLPELVGQVGLEAFP